MWVTDEIGAKTMPTMTSLSPALAETVWAKVSQTLHHELGDGAYNSYLAVSELRHDDHGDPVLVTPTLYARDWFQKNALRRSLELWREHDPHGLLKGVCSRAEFERSRVTTPSSETEASGLSPQAVTSPMGKIIPMAGIERDAPKKSRINGLQDKLTFDSFVAGRGNEFAFNMSKQVASWSEGPFHLVFFHGPYGYGKTHLMNAIAWEAQAKRPDARIVYLTAEKFTTSFVRSLQDKSTQAFKAEVRNADLLLIDDVHFLGNKTSSQEELFHSLTALLESNKRVIFTADRPPSHLTEIEARLRSHLSSGLVCALDIADTALRIGIVERKFRQLTHQLGLRQGPSAEVQQFLAQHVPGSIRELEGAVNTMTVSAGARLGSLTVEDAMALIQPNLKVNPDRRITVDEIQKLSADHFGLKQADLLSERRTRCVARPRQVAMWLCKQHTARSYPDIGRRFGGRDHTTVLHAVKKIEELLKSDDQIARDVEALTRKLRSA